jgi:hypothetical protein
VDVLLKFKLLFSFSVAVSTECDLILFNMAAQKIRESVVSTVRRHAKMNIPLLFQYRLMLITSIPDYCLTFVCSIYFEIQFFFYYITSLIEEVTSLVLIIFVEPIITILYNIYQISTN